MSSRHCTNYVCVQDTIAQLNITVSPVVIFSGYQLAGKGHIHKPRLLSYQQIMFQLEGFFFCSIAILPYPSPLGTKLYRAYYVLRVARAMMADPLSVSASIAGILQLAATVAQYINSARGEAKERKRLRDEIRSCQFVLQQLHDEAYDVEEGATWTATLDALGQPGTPLEQLSTTLSLAQAKLKPKAGIQKSLAVLKWPFT